MIVRKAIVKEEIVWRKSPFKEEITSTAKFGKVEGSWPVGTEIEVWGDGKSGFVLSGMGDVSVEKLEFLN